MDKMRVVIPKSEDTEEKALEKLVCDDPRLLQVGAFGSVSELEELLEEQRPDLVILPGIVPKILKRKGEEAGILPFPDTVSYRIPVSMSRVMDTDLEKRVTECLWALGVPAHIRGYHYIRDAVLLAIYDVEILKGVTKTLYPMIADKYHTTAFRVERGIRHAIEVAWNQNGEDFSNVFGHRSEKRGRPSNSEFIAMIADKIRLELKNPLPV